MAARLGCARLTVYKVRKRACERGGVATVEHKEQENRKARALDGAQEAHLVALTCFAPPDGSARWSLRLLRERLIEMEVVEGVGLETVRRTLKNTLKPWLKQMWCIPPQEDARFVCQMEDVLEVYARPYDPKHPVVCLDEAAKQLLGETRPPLLAQPEQPLRYDNEYVRNGTCSLFMMFEPLAAQRWVQVREQRTALDYAQVVKWMLEEVHPDAHKVVLVQDMTTVV